MSRSVKRDPVNHSPSSAPTATVAGVSDSRPRLLWLCGPSGVGKSTTGFEVFGRLTRAGIRAAYLDADQISLVHPVPAGGEHALRARALGAIWPNLATAGVRCLVLSGYVNTPGEAALYTAAVPAADVTPIRLRAEPDALRRRFLGRGWLPGLVDAALADADALDRTDLAAACVDTTGLTVPQAARQVLDRAGALPGPGPALDRAGALPDPRPVGVRERVAPPDPAPVLWITGPTGVGKSTVAFEIYRRLIRTGAPAAYVDLQQIGFLRPGAGGDAIRTANLAALWEVHRGAGARRLVVSGDVPHGADGLFAAGALTVCRLRASRDTLAERLLLRGRGLGPVIPGDELRGLPPATLRRIAERAAREDLPRDGALLVDTDGQSAEETARRVRLKTDGWA